MKNIKFIADVNVEKSIIDYLNENGYDVKWIPDYNSEITDEELFNLARKEKRILITNDKDFGKIVFLQKKISTGIILIRMKGRRGSDKVKRIRNLLEDYHEKLLNNFVIISERKYRFVPLKEVV